MGYKTILVHCDASKGIAGRLELALELGKQFDAHVVGLHVRRRFEAPMFTDGGFAMDALYQNYEEGVKAEETAAAELFNKAVGRFSTPSTEWRVVDGYLDDALADEARFADLILVGQADPEAATMATPSDLAESVALSTGRPVLVVPHIGLAKPPSVNIGASKRRRTCRPTTWASNCLPISSAASSRPAIPLLASQ